MRCESCRHATERLARTPRPEVRSAPRVNRFPKRVAGSRRAGAYEPGTHEMRGPNSAPNRASVIFRCSAVERRVPRATERTRPDSGPGAAPQSDCGGRCFSSPGLSGLDRDHLRPPEPKTRSGTGQGVLRRLVRAIGSPTVRPWPRHLVAVYAESDPMACTPGDTTDEHGATMWNSGQACLGGEIRVSILASCTSSSEARYRHACVGPMRGTRQREQRE